jgi:hypothetical protein
VRLAIQINALMDERDLSNFPAVVDGRQNDGYQAEAAPVKPFDSLSRKTDLARGKGLGCDLRSTVSSTETVIMRAALAVACPRQFFARSLQATPNSTQANAAKETVWINRNGSRAHPLGME